MAYDHKHNAANGEQNRDGSDDNRSWNHGIEGPSAPDSPAVDIVPLRRRSIRNLFATLVLAAGTPMITAGDEMGRTQRGNNNAYCQDNEISWVRWDLTPWRKDLLATARWLLLLRREHPALRSERFYSGRPYVPGQAARTSPGSTRSGVPFDHDRWHDPSIRTLQMVRTAPPPEQDTVLLVINGSLDAVHLILADDHGGRWRLAWDSVWEHPGGGARRGDRGRPARGAGRGDRRGRGAEHAGVRRST